MARDSLSTLLLGFLGGVAAIFLKAWLDQRAEERRHLREVRVAARLVAADLTNVWASLGAMQEAGQWWSSERDLGVSSWEENQRLLASALSNRAWHQLLLAVMSARSVQRLVARRLAAGTRAISEEDDLHLCEERRIISGLGHDSLQRLSETPPLYHRVRRRVRWWRRRRRADRLRKEGRIEDSIREVFED